LGHVQANSISLSFYRLDRAWSKMLN
jgi:hypothetical protein